MSRMNSIINAAIPLTSIEAPRQHIALVPAPSGPETTPAHAPSADTKRPSPATPIGRAKPAPTDALWDARAVAEFLGASASYVYKKVQAGKIPYVRIGWMVRFSPDAIRAWVKARAK